ncbi:MAG: acyl-CoA dehydrogenase family protein [Dehalococcoidia bacterium]|nr:acyl-CoA dehydrogenase family protein [Dehalococcoidia bacterium]
MDFGFTEEQEMLKKMARDFLTSRCPKKLVREMEKDEKGYSPEIWKEMAELGFMGLAFPEKYGGGDGTFLDLAVLLDEMGRACLPGPFFPTVVLAGMAILEAGSETQKKELLPQIAQGKLIATLATTEDSPLYDASDISTSASEEGGNFVINGTKLFVQDAQTADLIIVSARTKKGSENKEGISLFLVKKGTAGVTTTPLMTIAADKQAEVVFNKVVVPKENLLGELHNGWPVLGKVLQYAAAAKSVEMLGGVQQVLEMTVSYAKERVQFGKPIGTLQAIQHYCADMAIDIDGCRLIIYQAAWALNENMPCAKEVALAKAWVSDAYQRCLISAHQIHGAIGFTEDHDLPLYYRRAKAAELAFGDADVHRETVACEIGL